ACNEGNGCMTEVCDPLVGCKPSPVLDGTPCGGQSLCTAGACNAGVCGEDKKNPRPKICNVEPLLTCVMDRPEGGYTAVLGYRNPADVNVFQAAEDLTDLNVINGTTDPYPSWFMARQPNTDGTRQAQFTVGFTSSLTWQLGEQSVTVTAGSPR